MGRPVDIYFEPKKVTSNFMRWETSRLAKPSSDTQPTIAPMINLLARHSLQWRYVEFHIPNTWYPIFTPLTVSNIAVAQATNSGTTEPALTGAPLDLPLLVSASLHQDDEVAVRVLPQAVKLDLTLAPSLCALSLSFFPMSPAMFERANFNKITILNFNAVYNIDPSVLFPRLPNLEEAVFYRSTFSLTGQFRKNRHQKLRRLEVETPKASHLQKFLPTLILPQLKYLSLSVPTTMHYSNVVIVPHWEANLTALSLTCKINAEYDLIDVLCSLGSLQEFYLRDSNTEATREAGLSSIFFEMFHPDEDPSYLPRLEILSYEGQLAVQAIDFLEPLIIRSRMRGGYLGMYTQNLEQMAVLRKVKIQADQVSETAEFSIAEYPDPQYVWEIMRMMEEGILELITMDGEFWQ
jgi:hypothetical protein